MGLEAFRAAQQSIVMPPSLVGDNTESVRSADVSSKTSVNLCNEFAIACDGEAALKQTGLVQQVRAGILDTSQLSVRVGGAELAALARQVEETKKKQSSDTQMFLAMLDAQAEIWEMDLKSRYGENYVQTMLDTYLTDEERDGLSREEQLERLFDKYLDENGEIRDEYKGTQAAEDIHKLWKVDQARELGLDIRENGITPENEQKKDQLISSGSLDERLELQDNAYDLTVSVEVDVSITEEFEADTKVNTASLAFS